MVKLTCSSLKLHLVTLYNQIFPELRFRELVAARVDVQAIYFWRGLSLFPRQAIFLFSRSFLVLGFRLIFLKMSCLFAIVNYILLLF